MKITIRVASVLLMALLLGGCWPKDWSWNQKLIVEVQTPNGLVSGAGISKVTWGEHSYLAKNFPGGYSGEATVVDLGEGRFLFALLQEDTNYLAFRTFNGSPSISEEIFAAMSKFRGSKEVASSNYPMLVTFDDINDPASVKRVDPDNLVATFGEGYALKSITLEITDEPVTSGKVESVLGWLGDYYNKRFDGNRYGTTKTDNKFANSLASGAFDTENNK